MATEKSKKEIAAAFDEFWAAYPRRVAKQAAKRAFATAIKNGTSAATLIDGARRYANERSGQPGKFTKHPATWLRDGCWEDEAPQREHSYLDDIADGLALIPDDWKPGL